MSTQVRMPNLGAEATEARVLSWLCRVGDRVSQGQAMAEIETDKANVDIEAPVTGVLSTVLVSAGEIATVGTVLAVIEDA